MSETDATSQFDVFLSHNGTDKPAVRELAVKLKARGVKVWLDEDDLCPGGSWQEEIAEGIENSKAVAVLVSKDGIGPWENQEIQGALTLAVNKEQRVIPVLLPGASSKPKLPMFLVTRTWLDLSSGLSEAGIDKLIWGINGKKSLQPATPDAIELSSPSLPGIAATTIKANASSTVTGRAATAPNSFEPTSLTSPVVPKRTTAKSTATWIMLAVLVAGVVSGYWLRPPSRPKPAAIPPATSAAETMNILTQKPVEGSKSASAAPTESTAPKALIGPTAPAPKSSIFVTTNVKPVPPAVVNPLREKPKPKLEPAGEFSGGF